MKKSMIIIALHLLPIFQVVGQKFDCCDSVLKILNSKTVIKKCRPISSKTSDVIITIDNSRSSNSSISEKEKNKEAPVNKNPISPLDSIFNLELLKYFVKAFIAIVLALLAGGLALFQIKANVISSARIKWIEDLRDTLSKLYPVSLDTVTSAREYRIAKSSGKDAEAIRYDEANSRYLSDFNALSNKIKMLLNSSEPEHRQIEHVIDVIDKKLDKKNIDTVTAYEINDDLKLIVSLSKIIFKKEWDKSKRIFKI